MRHLIALFFTCFVIGCATASSTTQGEADFGRVGEPFGRVDVRHDEPVETCLDVQTATPEEHLESWRRVMREQEPRMRRASLDPAFDGQSFENVYAETSRAYAEAMPHAILSGEQRTVCHALFIARNMACGVCSVQSFQTRAILRCYLDELSELCPDGTEERFPDMARWARFCLYERGCDTMEGEYRP